jgi:Reverse transcriptase (RNA-dependent DNA polymerase)
MGRRSVQFMTGHAERLDPDESIVQLDPELFHSARVRDAISAVVRERPDLLPPDPSDEAIAATARINSVQKLFDVQIARGFPVSDRQPISARKSSLATRPVTPLSFLERVAFRVLSDHLRQELQDSWFGTDLFPLSYRQFSSRELDSATEFVVGADVNSFYQYVDHAVLGDEIVGLTSNWRLAEGYEQLLYAVMGRRVGLPQGCRSVGLAGDFYIASSLRALKRRGFDAWIYRDDFRIAAPSRHRAHEALEAIDSALQPLGLTVNTEKSWIRTSAEFTEWQQKPGEMFQEFSEEQLDVDLTEFMRSYDDDRDDDGTATRSLRTAARRAFDWWDSSPDHPIRGADGWVSRSVLRRAMRHLQRAEDGRALASLPRLLQAFPDLTRDGLTYMRVVGPHNEEEVQETLRELIGPGYYLSAWQQAWVAWAAISTIAPLEMLSWARDIAASSPSELTRAWCACFLIDYEELDATDLIGMIEEQTTPLTRAILLSGAARVTEAGSVQLKAATAGSVEQAIIDYFSESHDVVS